MSGRATAAGRSRNACACRAGQRKERAVMSPRPPLPAARPRARGGQQGVRPVDMALLGLPG
jgi:hypothetical protein